MNTPPVVKKRKISKALAKKRAEGMMKAITGQKGKGKGQGTGEGKEKDVDSLTPLEELFCQRYTTQEFFCNGTQSYKDVHFETTGKHMLSDVAAAYASKLLRKVKVQKRIDELIGDLTLNDQFVDKQLGKVITQDVSFQAKTQAIKEYNTLKKRTTQRVEHTISDLRTLSDADLAREEENLISFFTKK